MKFLMFIKHTEDVRSAEVPASLHAAMGEFVEASFRSGILKETGGLKPTAERFRVRLSSGRISVTDGPFTEAKEVIGGFAIVECDTRDDALRVAREFVDLHRIHWPAFECECEVRPLDEA